LSLMLFSMSDYLFNSQPLSVVPQKLTGVLCGYIGEHLKRLPSTTFGKSAPRLKLQNIEDGI